MKSLPISLLFFFIHFVFTVKTQAGSVEPDSTGNDSLFEKSFQQQIQVNANPVEAFLTAESELQKIVLELEGIRMNLPNFQSELDKVNGAVDASIERYLKLDAEQQKKKRNDFKEELRKLFDDRFNVQDDLDSITEKQIEKRRDSSVQAQNLKKHLNAYESACNHFDQLLAKDSAFYFKIWHNNVTYHVVRANVKSHAVRIHNNGTGAKKPLRFFWDMLSKKGAEPIALFNAGMYEPNGSAKGLMIEDGKQLQEIDPKKSGDGNFYLTPNGVFFIDSSGLFSIQETQQFIKSGHKKLRFATQSGPMLVVNGNFHRAFTKGSSNLNIRNGVGVIERSKNKEAVFVISEQPCNFYDFATVFKVYLNCKNALYLDGAISEMYLQTKSRKVGDGGGALGPVISISKRK